MACEMKPKPSEAGVPLLDIDRLLEKLKGVEKMLEYQLGSSLEIMAEDMHEEVGSPNNYVTIRSLLTLLLWMMEDTIVEPIEMNLNDGNLLILGKKALTEMKENVGKVAEEPTLGSFFVAIDRIFRESN